MTEQDEKQLRLEIEHIFDSGANELRVFNMVKAFIEKRYQDLNIANVTDSNSWLSPIESERNWQECHIKKIWEGYPNICPNWQILNGLIRFSCDNLNIEVTEPF